MMPLLVRRRRRLVPAFALAASLAGLGAAPAWAASVTPEQKQEMKLHYERATRAFDVGKFGEAIDEYGKIYEIGGDPAMLYNIGQAHRLNNQPADALRFYRRYLQRAPHAPNREDVEKKIAELEKIADDHGRGPAPPVVVAPPAPAPAVVPPVPAAPAAPAATAPPPVSATTSPAPAPPASAGAPPASPPPPAPATGSTSGRQWLTYSLIGAGGAALLLSAIEASVASNRADKLSAQSKQGGTVFNPTIETEGQRANAIAITSLLVGSAALVVGGIFFFTGRNHEAGAAADATAPPRISLAPILAPGSLWGAGAAWSY
jgi:tetratricopeptide (TPR) repeat protein